MLSGYECLSLGYGGSRKQRYVSCVRGIEHFKLSNTINCEQIHQLIAEIGNSVPTLSSQNTEKENALQKGRMNECVVNLTVIDD